MRSCKKDRRAGIFIPLLLQLFSSSCNERLRGFTAWHETETSARNWFVLPALPDGASLGRLGGLKSADDTY